MRTHLVRAVVEDDWGNYTNSQWRYDSFFNEWDLATAFDPGASAEDDDDKDDFTFWPDTPPPPPPPHVMFSQDILQYTGMMPAVTKHTTRRVK